MFGARFTEPSKTALPSPSLFKAPGQAGSCSQRRDPPCCSGVLGSCPHCWQLLLYLPANVEIQVHFAQSWGSPDKSLESTLSAHNMRLSHILSFLGSATLALSAAVAQARPPINTPVPMQPGAYPNCEQFYKASPGVTCQDIASAHRISLRLFLALNPQVLLGGGCEGGAILAHYWYCVNGVPGLPFVRGTPTRGNGNPANPPAPTTTTKTTTTPVAPATTTYPTITCSVDDCWRAFRLAVGGARTSQSSWCSRFMTSQCTASNIQSLAGVPNLVALQCTQAPPCQAVYSGCGCYNAGYMNSPRTWDR
ncbi:hypothetical protein SODALDRAFT_72888 [Sodiomyces alkalinus F11]|uniref:LysM domain-containing protein n=1 Tax=Sodiomyces alkalinus (strain CBS 110278 / VKM F-3762 / F11) TaxID=1314773 RepID=A0A3N2PK25_SODAK|nr:hypothetical protein SODALDRAFT_72888 [Sodiomyces alkalinus F11]ROT34878.1 hypothetical protein SODALDRAFT_72888 [Sodiomyces alkalinus F11]